MRAIQITLALLFIVLTLGAISVNLSWTDGARFEYRGWLDGLRK